MATETTVPAIPVRSESKPQAIQLRQGFGFAPSTFDEAVKLSKIIAESGLAPKDFQGKPQAIFVALQMGAEIGLAPMQAIQNIAVINGRPSLWGDAALAVVQGHSGYEFHKETFEGTGDSRVAVFQIKRKGSELHETRFGVAEAKKAGLWGKQGPWSQYPDRMMQMRARSFGLRDKFADALRGVSIAEEVSDFTGVTLNANDIQIEDHERELREKADELLRELSPSMNQAQRMAKIGQHKGKMQEFVDSLKVSTASAGSSPTDPGASEKEPVTNPEAEATPAVEASGNSSKSSNEVKQNGFSF